MVTKKKRKEENVVGKPINYDTKYVFRIDKKLLEELKTFCKENNMTVSEFVRECLIKGLNDGKR